MELVDLLEETVESFRKNSPVFPFNFCCTVSKDMHYGHGHVVVMSRFIGRIDPSYWDERQSSNPPLHAFNYDPETGLYYDLTASQFNSDIPLIVMMEEHDERIAHSPEEVTGKTWYSVEHYLFPREFGCSYVEIVDGQVVPVT